MQPFEEVKINKNKPTQRFACELLHRGEGFVILKYISTTLGKIHDITIRQGATTIAFYWSDRGYVLWRMYGRDAGLIGTLFHVCTNVTITDVQVSYLDLLIDVWVAPDGSVSVLDEDELAGCVRADQITQEEAVWIEKQKKIIINKYHTIIAEAAAFEQSHAPAPPQQTLP